MAQPQKRLDPQALGNTLGPLHNQYGEEAALAAQRYHDQVATIHRLTDESAAWERRALSAEGEITRLNSQLTTLEAKLDQTREQLTEERDSYKYRLATLVGEFHTAGGIILKCIEATQLVAPKQVDLATLTQAIEQDIKGLEAEAAAAREPELPLPTFLRTGYKIGGDAE